LIQATDTTSTYNRHDELEINEDFPGEIIYENPILANSLENEEELAILPTDEEPSVKKCKIPTKKTLSVGLNYKQKKHD
jgi:hypothetical protein